MTPVQIVVLRDNGDPKTDVFVETLRLAFEGSGDEVDSPNTYLSDAIDLGIRVLEPNSNISESEIDTILGGARVTIVVVVSDSLEQGRNFESKVGESHVVRSTIPSVPNDSSIQEKLAQVEPVFAPIVTALQAMECARRALSSGIHREEDSDIRGNLKLFISHAKVDGLVVARSLVGVLRQLQELSGPNPGFEFFYDAEHIKPGTNWQNELEKEAENCVLIALRTNAYENRAWCQREFLIAESNGVPIIEVDLRNVQYQASSLLPFDLVPTVRVQDGNLIRVVLHAMAAHLKVLRIQYGRPQNVKVLAHRPSVYSLASAKDSHNEIAYPDPKVSDEFIEAIEPILSSNRQRVKLTTYDDLS